MGWKFQKMPWKSMEFKFIFEARRRLKWDQLIHVRPSQCVPKTAALTLPVTFVPCKLHRSGCTSLTTTWHRNNTGNRPLYNTVSHCYPSCLHSVPFASAFFLTVWQWQRYSIYLFLKPRNNWRRRIWQVSKLAFSRPSSRTPSTLYILPARKTKF